MENDVNEKESKLAIRVSQDKMTGYLKIISKIEKNEITEEIIMSELSKNKIKYGINNEAINKIVLNPIAGEEFKIAEGLQPVEPINGRIEILFNINIDKKPKVLDNGNVDYHDLGLVQNVYKGQELGKVIDPIEGKDGMDVYGSTIPVKKAKQAIIPKGKNVLYDSKTKFLTAHVDGQASYVDNKIQVNDCFEVKENVDASTGDINFVGNVIVRKNVVNGFKINCSGTVEVYGVVEGGSIKAKGDIVLRKGVQGMNKSVIESEGDIISKYIENSTVIAQGNIRCDAIMHSDVKCNGILELEGKNGLIVGGTAKVGKEVIGKVIGSPMATMTVLCVGVLPSDIENLRNDKEKVKNVKSDLVKTEQIIVILNKIKLESKLTPEKEEMLTKSIRSKILLNNEINVLCDEISELENKIYSEDRGKVKALTIHPGVVLEMGNSKKFIKETTKNCFYYEEGSEIRSGIL